MENRGTLFIATVVLDRETHFSNVVYSSHGNHEFFFFEGKWHLCLSIKVEKGSFLQRSLPRGRKRLQV